MQGGERQTKGVITGGWEQALALTYPLKEHLNFAFLLMMALTAFC